MVVKVAGSYSFTIGDTTSPDVSKSGSFDTGTIVDQVSKTIFQASPGTITLSVPSIKGSFLHVKAYDSSGDPAAFTLKFQTNAVNLPQFTEILLVLDDYLNTPIYMTEVDITTLGSNVTIEYEMASM